MNRKEAVKHVERLIQRAADSERSEDVMRLTQAACNAANAILALTSTQDQSNTDVEE